MRPSLKYLRDKALYVLAATTLTVGGHFCFASSAGMYSPIGLSQRQIDATADHLLHQMTLAEKVRMMAFENVLDVPGVKSLGIPTLVMSDASVGVRRFGASTAYPSTMALAASWNCRLAYKVGRALGSDCRARGVNLIFGPGMNVMREPQDGRNFEYMGEDPYLTAQMVVPWIKGVQSQEVAACAKHFAGNEEETDRVDLNCIISRRALEEIYLPPFRAAVRQGHVWSLMAAYNKVNGQYCTANKFLLTDMLRRRWGFKGVLMSDWGASHSTLGPLLAGMDLEMHRPINYTLKKITRLLKEKRVTMSVIDQHVRRILRMDVAMGFLSRPQKLACVPRNNPISAYTAFTEEAQGAVLLKNKSHFLPQPVPSDGRKIIVVVGPMATPAVTGGGGSSYVIPIAGPVSLLDAIRTDAPRADVVHIPYLDRSDLAWQNTYLYRRAQHHGCSYQLTAANASKPGITGDLRTIDFHWPAGGPKGLGGAQGFTGVFRTKLRPTVTGNYMLKFFCTAGANVYINRYNTVEQWRPRPLEPFMNSYYLVAGKTYQLKITLGVKPLSPLANVPAGELKLGVRLMNQPLLTPQQTALIRKADMVVAGVGFGPRIEHEDLDRSFHLPSLQGEYLRSVGRLNPHTVVVLNCGGPVALKPWISHVDAFIDAWYPGENGNQAVADIIFGKINPSGHLPVTFSWSEKQEPAYGHFPGHDILGQHPTVHFAEGIFVGYRWFNEHHIKPAFPFGFGLSYTHFAIAGLGVKVIGHQKHKHVMVLARITNTGHRTGADVVQLYVKPPQGKLVRVVQKLEGFKRVTLKPGQSQIVDIGLNWHSFACFDTHQDKWIVPAGTYHVVVGDSSTDTVEVGTVSFKK